MSTAPKNTLGSMAAYAAEVRLATRRIGWPVHKVDLERTANTGWLSHWKHQVMLPFGLRRGIGPSSVLHLLDGSVAFAGLAARASCRVMVTVHDLIPVLQAYGRFPGVAAPSLASATVWRANEIAYRRAVALVCVSAASLRDLCELADVDALKCRVVPLPVRARMRKLAEVPVEQGREPGLILHVGNDAFYKNRLGVLRVFARLDGGTRLRMIGPRPGAELLAMAARLGVGDRVEWCVDADDGVLAESYRRARLMLFPSLYEGFGWPPLEAMAFGLPVLSSDRGSLPEVIGPCGPGIDPDDLDTWAARAQALLDAREEEYEALASGCRDHAAAFNQERFAKEMLAVYRSVMG